MNAPREGQPSGGNTSGSSGRTAPQGFRPPKEVPPEPPILIKLDGKNASLDAMAKVVNEKAAPFMSLPPKHQGAAGVASQLLGGALGLMSAPATLLDTGFAMATAGIAAACPALPAATLTALHLGPPHPHAHPPSLIPPAPPIPLPSIGTIIGAGAVSVLINGLPAARAGDIGIGVTCGSLFPPIEIITGSSSVFIGGSRAARMGDLTRHCNPVGGGMNAFGKIMMAAGMAAGVLGVVTTAMDAEHSAQEAAAADSAAEAEAAAAAAAGQSLAATVAAAQVAADAAALILSLMVGKDPAIPPVLGIGALMLGSPNVLIGGFPCPNLLESLKGLLKAAKGLRRGAKRNKSDEGGSIGAGCKACPR